MAGANHESFLFCYSLAHNQLRSFFLHKKKTEWVVLKISDYKRNYHGKLLQDNTKWTFVLCRPAWLCITGSGGDQLQKLDPGARDPGRITLAGGQ